MKPLIGITPHWELIKGQKRYMIGELYAAAIEVAGGIPVVLPYWSGEALGEGLARVDGILLSGGGDVESRHYNEEPAAILSDVVPERDRFELECIRLAVGAGLPMLGICRGAQVLNVAFGGTLYQDIQSQITGSASHFQLAPRSQTTHEVRLAEKTHVASLYRASALEVNSFHHQAVKGLAPGFVPAGWSGDGLLEAFENPSYPLMVGIQWHPECLWESMPEHLGPFMALVNRAHERMTG